MSAEVLFWLCLALAGYTFVGYPLLAIACARLFGSAPRQQPCEQPITVVIAARNEASVIAERLRNLFASDYPADLITLLLVDDGSSDGTADIAESLGDPRIRVLRLAQPSGKAVALNTAMSAVRSELTVYADARQRFTAATLGALVAPFADPRTGVVAGELHFRHVVDGHAVAADGSYARIERRLRFAEAQLGWAHAASGAVYAIRSRLFQPLPQGLILDDVYTPLQAVRAGLRVWVARQAVAVDSAGSQLRIEFRRKLRTLTGNWQLMRAQPWLLSPLHNPVFFAWCSHKLARLLAPWALLGALLGAAWAQDPWLQLALWLQLLAYSLAVASLAAPRALRHLPLAASAGSFILLNTAALLSLLLFVGNRRHDRLWRT